MPRKRWSANALERDKKGQAKLSKGVWRTEYIAVRDLKGDRPIYPGLVEALERVYRREIVPEFRRVAVRDLVVSDEGIDPALVAELVASGGPPLQSIPVVALADGGLWAFDDAYSVRVWQATNPELVITVVVIPAEPQI
jgi:hypothetical protein